MIELNDAHDLFLKLSSPDTNDSGNAALSTCRTGQQVDTEASRLLSALDYLQQNAQGRLQTTHRDNSTRDNRLALLKLATRFGSTFQFPLPCAPNAFFFGGMVEPSDFGITGHAPAGVAGRGASLAQAFESCVGEAAEFLSFIERADDPFLENADGSSRSIDSEQDWMLDGLGWSRDASMADCDWVEAHSLNDGHQVRFPSELVLRRSVAKQQSTRLTESTGVAAGPTLRDATTSALLEVVERDAIALWWYAGAPARRLNPSLALFEFAHDLLCHLRQNSPRDCWLLDLTTDLCIPVFAALSAETDGSAVVIGFSSHVDPERAIKSAVLELCQMELAQEISLQRYRHQGPDHLGETDRHWLDLYERLSLRNFPQLFPNEVSNDRPVGEESGTQGHLCSTLLDAGYEAYRIDLTRADIAIPVTRVIVPGLQSPKPDWISQRMRSTCNKYNQSLCDIGKLPSII